MARPTRGARHTPARQTQRRNGNGTATAQRQPDNVTCVWRRIIITFNTTTTFTTTSNRNSMVAGKSGLQANQTRSKHLACQGVAGKSGLQANHRPPGVAGKILQPPIPSKNPYMFIPGRKNFLSISCWRADGFSQSRLRTFKLNTWYLAAPIFFMT